MVLDESMHKSEFFLGDDGGGKDGKASVMEVSMNNPGPTAIKGGTIMLLMEVSMVGMTLAGTASPCGSW